MSWGNIVKFVKNNILSHKIRTKFMYTLIFIIFLSHKIRTKIYVHINFLKHEIILNIFLSLLELSSKKFDY